MAASTIFEAQATSRIFATESTCNTCGGVGVRIRGSVLVVEFWHQRCPPFVLCSLFNFANMLDQFLKFDLIFDMAARKCR